MSKLRALRRKITPAPVRHVLHAVRDRLVPRAGDQIMDAEYRLVPDPAERLRLTLVMPVLTGKSAFGGVTSGLTIFLKLAAATAAREAVDLRIIATDAGGGIERPFIDRHAAGLALDTAAIETRTLNGGDADIAVRAREMFVTYNWWGTLNISELVEQQARHFRQPRTPVLYLIQEYEPGLAPYSTSHMLAREAYDTVTPLWAIFNSALLQSHFARLGHRAAREFLFEPTINAGLRALVHKAQDSPRENRIVVYGRPGIQRNCYPSLVAGLRRWARDFPEYGDWNVVSAGHPHPAVPLGDGRKIRSVGKLSLEDYGELLLSSRVGVSLMASQHPSYPPLDMAHLGVRVVTNGYCDKDLSTVHPNIVSTPSLREKELGAAIAGACARSTGDAPQSHPQSPYLRAGSFDFVEDIADAIVEWFAPA